VCRGTIAHIGGRQQAAHTPLAPLVRLCRRDDTTGLDSLRLVVNVVIPTDMKRKVAT
jgi:hypothetical protein